MGSDPAQNRSPQSGLIRPSNPRTVFFNDSVAVAWMRGGFIEVAAQDAAQGPIFYLLPQMLFVDEAPPADARDLVYRRMKVVLSGQERATKYQRLTPADRQAIQEILRETKPGLPEWF